MKLNLDPDRKIKIPVDGGKVEFKLKDIMAVPKEKISLKKDFDPDFTGGFDDKAGALRQVAANVDRLAEQQDKLYAQDTYSLLIIFQAMDAAGKDSAIRHVMSGVNPQGCQVFSFKKPSAEDIDHNFLWRSMKCLPERGRIGIFNRSYYEDVLVVKVHPQILSSQRLPEKKFGKKFWARRYDDINAFEHHLVRSGTIVLKFFLNVSRDEQKRRFLERLENPEKHWKFSPADLAERDHWDKYMKAYEDALSATSTKWAPWHIVPADQKWATRAIIADVITSAIRSLGLKHPEVTEEHRRLMATALEKLTGN